ncbi:MAG TPA: haloacid dehalogenase type II [bacterium]|nr:haloacid dehalogenase type II [bacterium]
MSQPPAVVDVRALTFDVFGTVVDWRSSIIREGRSLGAAKGLQADWEAFADDWRGLYQPQMEKVRTGKLGWTKLDDLHRMSLDILLERHGIRGLSEAEIDHFNRAWHRLDPWPDVVAGLVRLKRRYPLATLSNGNVSLMVHLARYAGLPWDAILGAEPTQHYKPQPGAYLGTADYLSLPPSQCMLVAAHPSDLEAASSVGYRTALVPRPDEHGPGSDPPPSGEGFDLVAKDFGDLADQLGC